MNISQVQPASLTNYGITLSGSLPTPGTHRQERQSCETGEERVWAGREARRPGAGTAEVFPAGLMLTTSGLDPSFSAHYRFSIFSIAMGVLLRFL